MDEFIIVIEDDISIGQAMQDALRANGYRVAWFGTGAQAVVAVETNVPALILLDAGLPDIDGFSLCRRFREAHSSLPIILVTARDSEIDIVVGLDAGANDYVTKPFSMQVMLARIRAHLRGVERVDPNSIVELGPLVVDPGAYSAHLDATPLKLRRREFELLLLLAREAGKVVTRERLLSEIWGLHWESSTKTLDMHILALRRKIGNSVEILNVRGVGYRLVMP